MYFFKADPNKTIKIKYEDKQFFVYRPEEIDYDLLYESIAKAYSIYYSYDLGFYLNAKRFERVKSLIYTCDLKFNDEYEDSLEIDNLKEIILVKMKSNEDKKLIYKTILKNYTKKLVIGSWCRRELNDYARISGSPLMNL